MYAWFKILHIISAAVLFGGGLGVAIYLLYVNQQKNLALIAQASATAVSATWLFTVLAAFVQAITGFVLVGLHGYASSTMWILGSILGFLVTGILWLPIVCLQIRCRDLAVTALQTNTPLSAEYRRCYRTWCCLTLLVWVVLVVVFYLMTNKPEHL